MRIYGIGTDIANHITSLISSSHYSYVLPDQILFDDNLYMMMDWEI